MRKKFLAVIFCLLIAASAASSDMGLDVRPAGREVFEITPREIVTTTFRVTNSTSERRLFIGEVELPEGWRLITEDFPFELGPNEDITKLVSFFVPETTSAGRYKITYLVRARKYPSIRDFYTVDVIVSPGSKEKELQESPPFVVAGEDYRVCFSVINKTKTENTINISVESSENIPFSVDSASFKLGPGQSRIITVTVRPPANIAKKIEHRLRVTAQIGQDGKPGTQASAVHSIDIVPRAESAIEESGGEISAEDTIRQSSDRVEDKTTLIHLKKKSMIAIVQAWNADLTLI